MIGKISYISRNAFDSIVLSAVSTLTIVAIYSNYYYIFSAVLSIILVIASSITAGVGNRMATASIEENYRDFNRFNYFYSWIGSWFSICLLCLYQPFMELWVGKELMTSNEVMLLFVIYFYITQMGQCRSVYAAAAGIWWQTRYVELGEMITNIVLNIILGYLFGMKGILWATIISILIFGVVMRTIILYRIYFKRNVCEYYTGQLLWTAKFLFVSCICYYLCKLCGMHISTLIVRLGCYILICVVLPNTIFGLLDYANIKERQNVKELFNYIYRFFCKRSRQLGQSD